MPLVTVPWSPNDSIDVPFWSLGVEWYMYFASPILFWLARKRLSLTIFTGAFIGFVGVMLFKHHGYIFGWTAIFRGCAATLLGASLRYAMGDRRPNLAVLRRPVLVWLGKISYPLYVVQWPVITGLVLITPSWHGEIVAVCLILLLATMLHYAIEVPARQWLRDLPPLRIPETLPHSPIAPKALSRPGGGP